MIQLSATELISLRSVVFCRYQGLNNIQRELREEFSAFLLLYILRFQHCDFFVLISMRITGNLWEPNSRKEFLLS